MPISLLEHTVTPLEVMEEARKKGLPSFLLPLPANFGIDTRLTPFKKKKTKKKELLINQPSVGINNNQTVAHPE